MKPFLLVLAGALIANMATGESNRVSILKPIETPPPPLDSATIEYKQKNLAPRRRVTFVSTGVQYQMFLQSFDGNSDSTPLRHTAGNEEAERINLRIMEDYRMRSESNPSSLAPPTLKPSSVEDILTRPK